MKIVLAFFLPLPPAAAIAQDKPVASATAPVAKMNGAL